MIEIARQNQRNYASFSEFLPGSVIFVEENMPVLLASPCETVVAFSQAEVLPALRRVETRVAAGYEAAGFVAYEAAAAFDVALGKGAPGDPLPLLWFGLYATKTRLDWGKFAGGDFSLGSWTSAVSEAEYGARIDDIRSRIAAGETYQANYTIPWHADFHGDTVAWFAALCQAQRTPYAALLNLGRYHVVSVSPELFFRLDGDRIETRPMKGTARRGRWREEDEELRERLLRSEKDRAENIMIVDLLRNDLGRIATPGSVDTEALCVAERYETVWQLVSRIAARTQASVPEIFTALFPCGSVTGAPKVRTMHILRELESAPRGVYCGAIGRWRSPRRAEFSVAIRTAVVDTEAGRARYSSGGGIVWDSTADREYAECRTKIAVLTRRMPLDFSLLESLRYEQGYRLLEQHIARMAASAAYFDYPFDTATFRKALQRQPWVDAESPEPLMVRALLTRDGALSVEARPAPEAAPVRLALARTPVDRHEVFLFHKTTERAIYDAALGEVPGYDDALLWNREGELTESTRANLVLLIDGIALTPARDCGLLAGTFRACLLEEGVLREAILTREDLRRAEQVWLANSVRGWIPVEEVHDGDWIWRRSSQCPPPSGA